jgi:hypothetical protein
MTRLPVIAERRNLKKLLAYLDSILAAHALPETTTIIHDLRSIIKDMMAGR